MGRREEAATLFWQAAELYLELQDLADEGRARNNAAIALIELNRHDEARTELLRAIECNAPYGHAATPWKAFNLLTRLEQATGNREAAAWARQRAIAAFLAYRRDGGENLTGRQTPQLAAGVARAIQENETEAAARQLEELQQHPDLPGYLEPLIPALQRTLTGSRDPALADDPALQYTEAAELKLLLEQILQRIFARSRRAGARAGFVGQCLRTVRPTTGFQFSVNPLDRPRARSTGCTPPGTPDS